MSIDRLRAARYVLCIALGCGATSAVAHEAWLLTPAEIAALATAPVPALFQSQIWLGVAAFIAAGVACFALSVEKYWQPVESFIFAPVADFVADIGALLLRIGLGVMLLLAAAGGLPRHGTALWAQPTLLVPDMQLQYLQSADLWIWSQALIGICFILGFMTRLAAIALAVLACFGLILFGQAFLSYTPHFIGPSLIVFLLGGGVYSLDFVIGTFRWGAVPAYLEQPIWRAAQILVGVGFVYLAIAYKVLQPTLLIAILEHGNMLRFGLPMSVIALVMTGVEIICGLLLILGRLVRPVSLAIIGAITMLAVVLAETPLFHLNLYGAMICFLMAGRKITLPLHVSFEQGRLV